MSYLVHNYYCTLTKVTYSGAVRRARHVPTIRWAGVWGVMLMLRGGFFGYFATIVAAAVLNTGPTSAAVVSAFCCADLEERIAELEATAANKGNRKMSLSISGSINRVVLWWDDGRSSGTYYGLDSGILTSRFIFSGIAKMTPKVTTGFQILINQRGANTLNVSQLDEDGKLSTYFPNVNSSATGPIGIPSLNAHNTDALFADARNVYWWLEHEDLGRLSVGRLDMAGVWTTIDLTSNVFNAGSGSVALVNGNFLIRGPAGQYYTMVWGNITDPANAFNRSEQVRYDSPTWKGFIYSASVGEAGDYWGTMLRYFGEHSGFRIVGQLGYERVTDVATPGVLDPANAAYTGRTPNITGKSLALSAMHLPSGLFMQGHFISADFGGDIIGATSGYFGEGTVHKKSAHQLFLQGGISKNWLEYGATSIYGEYIISQDYGADLTNATGTTLGRDYLAPANTTGFTAVRGVTSTDLRTWGFGIAQDFHPASTVATSFASLFSVVSTTIYVGYRHFDPDIRCTDLIAAVACSGGASVAAAPGTFAIHKLAAEPIDVVISGARVQF